MQNTGLDNSGTNCNYEGDYKIILEPGKIDCQKINISEDFNSKRILSAFFMENRKKLFKERLKRILKKIIPEALLKLWRAKDKNIFSGDYTSWDEAEKLCSGYDQDNILKKVAKATEKVVAGEAVFERDSMPFYHEEYNWTLVNTLLKAAAENNNDLCVLDFGGALGSTYFQNRKQFSKLKLKWCVVEQANFAELGAEKFQTEELRFYKDIVSCVKENKVNAILLSSVLQYLEKPYDAINGLKNVKADYLIVDRMPVLKENTVDRLAVQHVPACIYKASYPIRFLAETNLLARIEDEYDLQEKFDALGGRMTLEKPHEYAFYMGYIFKLKKAG